MVDRKPRKYAASKIKYLLPPERNFHLCSLDRLPHLEVSFLIAAAYDNTSLITPLEILSSVYMFTRVSYSIRGLGLLRIRALVLRGTTNAVCYLGRTRHDTTRH